MKDFINLLKIADLHDNMLQIQEWVAKCFLNIDICLKFTVRFVLLRLDGGLTASSLVIPLWRKANLLRCFENLKAKVYSKTPNEKFQDQIFSRKN